MGVVHFCLTDGKGADVGPLGCMADGLGKPDGLGFGFGFGLGAVGFIFIGPLNPGPENGGRGPSPGIPGAGPGIGALNPGRPGTFGFGTPGLGNPGVDMGGPGKRLGDVLGAGPGAGPVGAGAAPGGVLETGFIGWGEDIIPAGLGIG